MGHKVLYVLRTQESLNRSVWDKDPLLEQPSPSISPSSAISTAQLASAAGLGALQCCWKHMVLCFLLEDLPDPTLVAASSGCGEEHCWTPLLALLSSIPALSAASPCGHSDPSGQNPVQVLHLCTLQHSSEHRTPTGFLLETPQIKPQR